MSLDTEPVAVTMTQLAATAAPAAQPPRSEQGETRRALAFVYAGYLFRYAYLLVLIPFYGRVLGADEYGRLLAAMSLYQVVWMLTEYGFPIVGARDVAGTADRQRIAGLYARHMMGRLALALPALAIGLGGTLLSPVLRANPALGILATANGIVAAFNLGWYFQGTLSFRTSVMIELAGFAINLPLILLLVRGPGDGWMVLSILLASSTLCTVVAHGLALRAMDRRGLRWQGGLALIAASTALFVHRGLTIMMASSSTYLLSLFASAAQVGWYGVAERFATVGLSLMQPANHVLVGTVARRISIKESEGEAYALMRTSLIVMTAFGMLLLACTVLLAGTVVPLVLGPSFAPTVPMLQVMGLMFPFAAFCQVTAGYVLIPLRFDGLMSAVSLFGAAVTVGLVVLLGQRAGGTGVAWARTLGGVVLALALLAVLHRKKLLTRIWHA
jgi:PST family polysaccharide transporter